MTATNQRDWTRHEFSITPIINGVHHWGKTLITGDWNGRQDGTCPTGEARSVEKALELLTENEEVQRYHLYHSYPSPGPQSRYVGAIVRDKGLIRPA